MIDLNQVTLIGTLSADPDIRAFQDGGQYCILRVATVSKGKDKDFTSWHSAVVKSDAGIAILKRANAGEGSRIAIVGKLQTRKWTDQSGNARYTTEVVVDRWFGTVEIMPPAPRGSAKPNRTEQRRGDDLNDEIPF